jgi:Mrp family chromosome partitioning ATPase
MLSRSAIKSRTAALVRSRYRAPPTPDARVLGRMADAVVMVNRAGHTTRDAAVAAQHRFSEDQTRVLGTILNDWDPSTSPNGYYGYY